MASFSSTYPSQRPVFSLDAANAGRLDPRMTFTRASTANVFDGSKHLSSENLIAYSNPVTSQWTETNTAITVNSTAAPDGTNTASNVLETAATGYHEIRETFACTNAVSHTATFYAKANGRTVVRFLPRTSSGVIANVEFTLSGAGSESLISGTATRSIAAVGSGGWYKLTVTFTGNATATGEFQVNICESAGTDSYAGDATKGVYLWGAQVASTGEIVLNGTSGQIHREYAPSLVSKSNNIGRFDYSTDGQSAAKGILIEGQTQNLNSYSEDFSHANYNKFDGSIESNAAIAPDGNLTADLFVEDTGTSTHYISKAVSTGLSVGSTQYAISVYAKSAGRSKIKMYDNGQSTPGTTVFDLANGTVISGAGNIEACGNGWYRCTVIPTADYGTIGTPTIMLDNGSGTNYQGDGYSGVLLWGLQLETGNGSGTTHSSSYIGTTSSTVTRAAESLSVATADIGYTGGPVTVVGEVTGGQGYYPTIMRMSGPQDRLVLYKDSATAANATNNIAYVQVGSTLTASGTIAGSYGSTKVAITSDTDRVAYTADGGAVTVDTSSPVVSINNMTIGVGSSSGTELNANLKRLVIYGESMSDTNLQALTS